MSLARDIMIAKAFGGGGGGGGGGALVVNVTDVDGVKTCDKTAGEMWAACQTGVVVTKAMPYGEGYEEISLITSASFDNESAHPSMFTDGLIQYKADTADDNPSGGGGD